jgi:hypothetical protein
MTTQYFTLPPHYFPSVYCNEQDKVIPAVMRAWSVKIRDEQDRPCTLILGIDGLRCCGLLLRKRPCSLPRLERSAEWPDSNSSLFACVATESEALAKKLEAEADKGEPPRMRLPVGYGPMAMREGEAINWFDVDAAIVRIIEHSDHGPQGQWLLIHDAWTGTYAVVSDLGAGVPKRLIVRDRHLEAEWLSDIDPILANALFEEPALPKEFDFEPPSHGGGPLIEVPKIGLIDWDDV